MEKIKIPHTDLEVSRLAMGCMGLGGGFELETKLTSEHEQKTRAFLDAAEEIGIDFFDHAKIMAAGRSEEVSVECSGKTVPQRSNRHSIQMRHSLAGRPPGTPNALIQAASYLESVDAILGRLGTDRLEILLLHRPDCLWEGEEIVEGVRETALFRQGALFRRFQSKSIPNRVSSIPFSAFACVGSKSSGNEPAQPWGC